MDPPHGVPVRFWLYPLPGSDVIYRELSDSVAWRVTRTLEEFEVLADRLQLLRERKAVMALPNMASVVKQFQAIFTEFLRTFKMEIKSLRSEIKGKAKEEETLTGALMRLQQLPIAPEKIKRWIESREREADVIELVVGHSTPRRQSTTPSRAKCRVTLVADIYCPQADRYLEMMESTVKNYHDGAGRMGCLETNMPQTGCDIFDSMSYDNCKNMATEFNYCYKEHQSDADIQFEVADDGTDKLRKGQMYFEIRDKASHIAQFSEGSLLPDGVSCPSVRHGNKTGFLTDKRKRDFITNFLRITRNM